MNEVVAVAPVGRTVSARESAVLVSDDERPTQRRRDCASTPTDIDWLGVGAKKNSGPGTIAREAPRGVGGDRLRPLELTRRRSLFLYQCGDMSGDREVRLLSGDLG